MNDFLTNLVTHSLEPQAELQPRLASRFEPLRTEPAFTAESMVPGMELDAQPLEQTNEGVKDARTPASRATTRDQIASSDLIPDEPHPQREPMPPKAKPAQIRGQPMQIPDVTHEDARLLVAPFAPLLPTMPKPEDSRGVLNPIVEQPRRDGQSPVSTSDDLEASLTTNRPTLAVTPIVRYDLQAAVTVPIRKRAEDEPDEPMLAETAVIERNLRTNARPITHPQKPIGQATTDDDAPEAEAPALRPSPRAQAETDATNQTQPVQADVAPAPIVPRIQVMEAALPLRAAETHAPTIHVTIGRVEVRAAAPAQPHAAAKPTIRKPALSLEDYLRQRANADGGAR